MKNVFTKIFTFLFKSFSDSRGVPDGGRISQFVCIAMSVSMVTSGIWTHRWAPLGYYIATLGVAATGTVASVWDTRNKIKAEAAVAIARAKAEAGINDAPATEITSESTEVDISS